MNDICFDIENMYFTLKDCLAAENRVKDNLYALQTFVQKLKQEIPTFSEYGNRVLRDIQEDIGEVTDLIRQVDQKIADAQSQKQQELPPPAKPSIPADAKPEQKQAIESAYRSEARKVEEQNRQIQQKNQRIEAYIPKCSAAKSELEAILSNLHQLEVAAKDETTQTASSAKEAFRRAQEAANQDSSINSAMRQFNEVFDLLYQSAQALCQMESHSLRSYSYMDKQFVIRNTHSHISQGGGFSVPSRSSSSARSGSTHATAEDEELCIRDRDSEAFFAKAEGAFRIRMPSANLHKLGGKSFAARMETSGYRLVTQDDGATIDANGMLHWEKQDV